MKEVIKIIKHIPTCKICKGHCWKENINRQRIGEIIGEASMCWSETPKGIFQSDKAVKLIDEIMNIYSIETIDACYLTYDESGHLTCSFNHKIGDECLMDKYN